MAGFLIDEDLPRSTADALRQAGFAAADVRDVGLRGHRDADVFAYAQDQALTLITADTGFTNILRYPLGTHSGIIVIRVPNDVSTARGNQLLVGALATIEATELAGALVIVEPGRTRIRRLRVD